MKDAETGSWWQQVSGKAILGPMKGTQLKLVPHDELTFATWKSETRRGRVLKPIASVKYASANWEEEISRLPVVTKTSELPPRTLIIGISMNEKSKAYPFASLQRQVAIVDSVGGVPVLIAIGDDQKSVRVFERNVDAQTLNLFAKPQSRPVRFVDSNTGSEWDFSGTAVAGPLQGKQLKKIPHLKDFWFDWKNYHPHSEIYALR
jgi:Protein of unknown function (DUF3179)